jgi:putative transposase
MHTTLNYLVSEFTTYYNTKRPHMERNYLPPIRDGELEGVATLKMDRIELKKYVGGLVRKVA